VGRGRPPSRSRPTDVSATPPATPTPPLARLPAFAKRGEPSPPADTRTWSKRHARTSAGHRHAFDPVRQEALSPAWEPRFSDEEKRRESDVIVDVEPT